MTESELDLIRECLFTYKIHLQDMIDLEKAGIPQGFKKGYLESELENCDVVLNSVFYRDT